MDIQPLIRWLRLCYREDRSHTGVRDFFASSVMHRRMTRDEEKLLTGLLDHEVAPPNYSENALPYMQLYRRERELIYGALFVCGKHNGKIHRAPLLIYPGQLTQQDGWVSQSLDLSSCRLNPSALDLLDGADGFEEALREAILGEPLRDAIVAGIRRIISTYCPDVQLDSLDNWPYLAMAKEVENAGKNDKLSVISACGMALVERSVSIRGVLDELDTLSSLKTHAPPLRHLLGSHPTPDRDPSGNALYVPATLSDAQEKILKSARVNPVTVCHGPPGTGKTFTIAAIALDHVSRGESVLIASRSDHAVDVLHGKIDSMLQSEAATVRAGKKHYLKHLKSYLELCLSGKLITEIGLINLGQLRDDLEKKIRQIQETQEQLENEFAASIQRGAVLAKPKKSWLDRVRSLWAENRVKSRPLLVEMWHFIEDLNREREQIIQELGKQERLASLAFILNNQTRRNELKKLLAGLNQHQGVSQEAVFKTVDFSIIFRALPIWLAKTDDISRVLPLQQEMFDIAIIDEASQCDIASILPILHRAKRIVIAGDTKQLRHISFLAEKQLQYFASECALPAPMIERFHYRKNSLMDLAAANVNSHDQTGFLDEHFRSKPAIIRFSNTQFYHNTLKIMKERPWDEHQPALMAVHCQGQRDASGVNTFEIKQLLKQLNVLLTDRVQPDFNIGILSPFRAQVDAIWQEINLQFSAKLVHRLIHHYGLIIGTAHTFQGEERDIMLISLCIDPTSSSMARRFIEREDVFNVSITRAKSRQWVFHSLLPSDLPQDSLLYHYLHHIAITTHIPPQKKLTAFDKFARDVKHALEAINFTVSTGSHIAGIDVDLIITKSNTSIGIDLVGYPGQMTGVIAHRKTRLLARAGMKIIPLGYPEWTHRRNECIQAIREHHREKPQAKTS